MNDITRTSKELPLIATEVRPIYEDRHQLLVRFSRGMSVDEMNRLHRQINELLTGASNEPPVECAGCEEFVRMQHDIASILGVDDDTDSISLHDRIYGALSTRAAQPPGEALDLLRTISGGVDEFWASTHREVMEQVRAVLTKGEGQ